MNLLPTCRKHLVDKKVRALVENICIVDRRTIFCRKHTCARFAATSANGMSPKYSISHAGLILSLITSPFRFRFYRATAIITGLMHSRHFVHVSNTGWPIKNVPNFRTALCNREIKMNQLSSEYLTSKHMRISLDIFA